MSGMELIELAKIVSDEERSFRYLLGNTSGLACPSCGSKGFYVMSRSRVRCSRCRRDFRPLKPTVFSRVRIPCSRWLVLVKLFELSMSARKAAREAAVDCDTALKAFHVIRTAILRELAGSDSSLRGIIEADEAYFGGKRKGERGRGSRNKTIVYEILERNGKVSVSILRDASAESLIGETVRKVRRGSVVYTDRWGGYDSLMFCGYKHLSVDHKHKFRKGKVYINGIEGFWSFAKERLIKHHGISKERFLYYIKEMEWRYNNRDNDVYNLIIKYMLGANGR